MKLAFDEIRPDEYTEAEEARDIGSVLIERISEHAHLEDATIGYIFRDDELRRRGKVIAAEAILVERILQADKRYGRIVRWAILRVLPAFETYPPDFLILIDRNIWEGMDQSQRIALVDHELSHCAQAVGEDGETSKFTREGMPVWTIKGHDLEEFCGVIERNGLWNEELANVARVIIDRLSDEAKTERTIVAA